MSEYQACHFCEDNLFFHYDPYCLNYPKHLHRSFELIYVIEGDIEVSVNDKTFYLHQKNCILILPYEIHSITTQKYSYINIYIFPPEYVKTFLNIVDGKTLENPVFNLSPNIEALILDKISKTNLNILELKACFYLLCSESMKHTRLLDSIKHDYELLHKILNYIQNNFTKDISLKDVSAECGYSYTYLSKYLNNILGLSFVDFINENRVNYALYLLKNTQNTITDIAYICGYSNIRSFNRNFLKITNRTPKSYRISNSSK